MTDLVVADGHISYETRWTDVLASQRLILGCQEQRVAGLAKAAPCILGDIALKQNPLGILKLEVILHDERVAVNAANEARLSDHPGHGLEQVVLAYLDVCGSSCGCAPTQRYVFASGLADKLLFGALMS